MILHAAQEIIEKDGLSGLTARAIARRIDYSPGTLYNMFENLDDLVLHVEAQILDELDRRLSEVSAGGPPLEAAKRLADAYLQFTRDRPRLWNLLFEHHLPSDSRVPIWYQEKLDNLLLRVEDTIAPLFPASEHQALKRSARVLWAGVHGITSLATSDKLSSITSETAQVLVQELITSYVIGLQSQLKQSV